MASDHSTSGSERLDEVGPYDDPELTEMVFECPDCGEPIAEWTDCPACGWYDEDRWQSTMSHYSECSECGQTIGGGSICDGCEELEQATLVTDGGRWGGIDPCPVCGKPPEQLQGSKDRPVGECSNSNCSVLQYEANRSRDTGSDRDGGGGR